MTEPNFDAVSSDVNGASKASPPLPPLEDVEAILEREQAALSSEDGGGNKADATPEPGKKKEKAGKKEAKPELAGKPEKAKRPSDDVAEKPVEGESGGEPEEPGIGKFRRALVAREKQVVEAKNELRTQREALEHERATLRRDMGSFIDERELASKSPVEYLRKVHGWTDEKIAHSLLEGGKPPEAKKGPETEVEKRLAQLEKELHDEREGQKRVREEAQRAEMVTSAQRTFAEMVGKNDEKWPLLNASYEPEEIGQMAFDLYQRAYTKACQDARAKGLAPPKTIAYGDEQIADALEEVERTREERRKTKRGASGESTAQEKPAVATKSASQGTATESKAKKETAPTLTGRTASEKSLTSPVDILLLDEEQENALVKSKIREALGR